MSRWSDMGAWRPTAAHGGEMHEYRGLVLHIAEGFYEGTIAYQQNKANKVSSHFVAGRNQGELAQLVDTDEIAWTQREGNGHWLSLECAGFTTGHRLHKTHPGWEKLSLWQVACAADLLSRMHHQYGTPIQVAVSSNGRGLGHHSMGGTAWGHLDCPGEPIIAQKATIVALAKHVKPEVDVTPAQLQDALLDALESPRGKAVIRDNLRAIMSSEELGHDATVTRDQALQNTEFQTRGLSSAMAQLLARTAPIGQMLGQPAPKDE